VNFALDEQGVVGGKTKNQPNKSAGFAIVSQFERKTNNFYAHFYYKIKGQGAKPHPKSFYIKVYNSQPISFNF
jgi:hypothetical protein